MRDVHYLNEKWSVWYDDYRDGHVSRDYNKNLFLISTFETIEVICINSGLLERGKELSID